MKHDGCRCVLFIANNKEEAATVDLCDSTCCCPQSCSRDAPFFLHCRLEYTVLPSLAPRVTALPSLPPRVYRSSFTAASSISFFLHCRLEYIVLSSLPSRVHRSFFTAVSRTPLFFHCRLEYTVLSSPPHRVHRSFFTAASCTPSFLRIDRDPIYRDSVIYSRI